jgi:putative inorganic carbon (HCO3(-)) transporter
MLASKIQSFTWKVLLTLIFLRPFLNEYVFLSIGFWYIFTLIFCSAIYLVVSDRSALFTLPLNLPGLLFTISVIISIVFSGFSSLSIFELYLFIPNFAVFYIVSKIKPEQKRQLVYIIFLSAAIMSIYAIYQYFISYRHILAQIKQIGALGTTKHIPDFLLRRRVFVTFFSPNIFASYMAVMLFLGMGFFITTYNQKRRTIINLAFIPLFTMAVSLLLAKSLGALLALFVTLILFIFCLIFYLPEDSNFKRLILKRYNSNITFVLSVLIFIFILFITWPRLIQLFNFNYPHNSIVQRFNYWITSLKIIQDFPLTGVGWRKLGFFYKLYKPLLANASNYSHNVFLQIMAETGILGLLSFIWIVAIFLKAGLRAIKIKDEQQGLKIGLFCAGCCFLLHNLIEVSFYFGQVSLFWWIILGLFNSEYNTKLYARSN